MRLSRDQIADRLRAFDVHEVGDHEHRAAAVVLAVATVGGDQGVWLTKRAPKLRAHSGQWALPGGRIDEGETLLQAGLREMHEEIGLQVPPESFLGRLDDYQTRSGFVISPVVAWCGEDPTIAINPQEVARLEHVSFAELDVDAIFIDIPESDRPVIQLPIVGSRIHAPTAAVMYQFREVVLRGRHTRVAGYEQPVFAWK